MLLNLLYTLQHYIAELKREEGQGMVEYALIIALIAVVLVTALTGLSSGISGVFTNIVSHL